MSDCLSIDPLITPYVDGDIGDAERRLVDAHVRACPPCHSRVAAEQAVPGLVQARRASLCAEAAAARLRARCAALGAAHVPPSPHRGAPPAPPPLAPPPPPAPPLPL